MKYIITESQFNSLFESKEYLDTLLDKINQNGMDSLSDKEKESLIRISKGETVYEDEPEQSTDVDTYNADGFFLHYFQNHHEIEVDDVEYRINVTDNSVEIIGGDLVLNIEPRFDEGELVFSIDNVDETKSLQLKIIPEGEEQMRIFVIRFYQRQLPQIIRSLV